MWTNQLDMLKKAIDETTDWDRKTFDDFITAEQTAKRLVSIVNEDTFASGSRVKYD